MMKKEKIFFTVDLEVYPLEAIYMTAYVFIDRVYIYLALGKKDQISVEMTAKESTSEKQLEIIKGQFQNELLNASLRLVLEKNNKKIRQSIVERALFSSVGEEEIWSDDDSTDIAVPWEDKNK